MRVELYTSRKKLIRLLVQQTCNIIVNMIEHVSTCCYCPVNRQRLFVYQFENIQNPTRYNKYIYIVVVTTLYTFVTSSCSHNMFNMLQDIMYWRNHDTKVRRTQKIVDSRCKNSIYIIMFETIILYHIPNYFAQFVRFAIWRAFRVIGQRKEYLPIITIINYNIPHGGRKARKARAKTFCLVKQRRSSDWFTVFRSRLFLTCLCYSVQDKTK